jgi:hypothetical protein
MVGRDSGGSKGHAVFRDCGKRDRTTGRVVAFLVFLLWQCGVVGVVRSDSDAMTPTIADVLPDHKDISRVTYRIGHDNARLFIVSDPESISTLLEQLEFQHKEPCFCDHFEELWFGSEHHESRFSICDHCLTLVSPDKPPRRFKMPADLWESLQALCAGEDSVCVK